MSRKSLAIGIALVVIIGSSILYLVSSGIISLPNSSGGEYAGYTQIKVTESGYTAGFQEQKIGEYEYFLWYAPTTIQNGITSNGWLQIEREDVSPATELPLSLSVLQTYYGITLVITQIQPEFLIIEMKQTS